MANPNTTKLKPPHNTFSNNEKDILEQVWEVYGGYTANQLEMLSHQEVPWLNARKEISPEIASSNLIKDIDIFFDQQAV